MAKTMSEASKKLKKSLISFEKANRKEFGISDDPSSRYYKPKQKMYKVHGKVAFETAEARSHQRAQDKKHAAYIKERKARHKREGITG